MTKRSVSKQGQSDSTEFKERGLQAAFTINLRVFCDKFKDRYTYWHFDLNSGCGYNNEVGCIGSPLAFLRAADSFPGLHYMAAFCDKDADALNALMQRKEVKGNDQAFCFHGDNASLIDAIPTLIEQRGERSDYAMGLVLSDPNGFETPLDELAELGKRCPRLDVVLHWNSRIRRLYRGQNWDFVDVDEAIEMIGKRHWLIRKPMGAHQWTVLIGRNMRIGEHRALGFHHLDSDIGRHILHRCRARIDGAPILDPQMELEF